jgi:two-component system phosphate regulon response regulator PhoB
MKSIVIIEDEETLLRMLSEKLTHEGFKVWKALNGEEGMHMIQTKKPDLVLLDVLMPRMDGIHMLREMRSHEWGKDVPVIILSNLSDDRRVAESMIHGVYDYLIKTDWSLEEVAHKVKERLSHP